MRKLIYSTILMLFTASGLLAKNSTHTDSLARILIVPLADKTRDEHFQYISEEMVRIIQDKLSRKFEYRLIENTFEEDYSKKKLDEEGAETLADKYAADIVVYGHYTYNRPTGRLYIYLNILYAADLAYVSKTFSAFDGEIEDSNLLDNTGMYVLKEIHNLNNIYRISKRKAEKNKSQKEDLLADAALAKSRYTLTGIGLGYLAGFGFDPNVSLRFRHSQYAELSFYGEKFSSHQVSLFTSFAVGYRHMSTYENRFLDNGFSMKLPLLLPIYPLFAFASLVSGRPLPNLADVPLWEGMAFHFRRPSTSSWGAFYVGIASRLYFTSNSALYRDFIFTSESPVRLILTGEFGVRLYFFKKTILSIYMGVGSSPNQVSVGTNLSYLF